VTGWALGPEGKSDKKPQGEKAAGDGLDSLKLNDNDVVVLWDPKKTPRPGAVLLSPKKFNELQQQLRDLRRKLRPDKPMAPSTCALTVLGTPRAELAQLRAEFKFKTEGPQTRVALGCGGAQPKNPQLGDKETLLQSGDDGFVALTGPGDHVLTLELEVPVVSERAVGLFSGARRKFDMDLPRAAVTTLRFEALPNAAAVVRCNDRVVRKAQEVVALGPAKHLTVAWKKPVPLKGKGPLLSADGKITVRVGDKFITTEADLTLQDLRGLTSRWVIRTPEGTTAEVGASGERGKQAGVPTITPNPNNSEHTLTLAQPSADPLRVVFTVHQLRSQARIPIGPFAVVGANQRVNPPLRRQQGLIVIRAPADVRLAYHPAGGPRVIVSEQEVTDEQRANKIVAAFKYWNVPQKTPGQSRLLDLDVTKIKGKVETEVEHGLQLQEGENGWTVRAVTSIHVTPLREGVDVLEFQLPRTGQGAVAILACWPVAGLPVNLALAAGFSPPSPGAGLATLPHPWPFADRYFLDRNASTTNPVENIRDLPGGRVRISLAVKKESKFTLTLRGFYQLRDSRRARLELPRPLNTLDRGGVVRIKAPPGQELLVGPEGQEVVAPDPSRVQRVSDLAPQRVEFAWRPFRPELPVTVETDLTLGENTARVRQQFLFRDKPAPDRVLLRLKAASDFDPRVAGAVGDSFRVSGGGRLASAEEAAPRQWLVALPKKATSLKITYQFPISRAGLVRVPLIWPARATRVESKVRVWSEPGTTSVTVAAPVGHRWREDKTEAVRGQSRLPLLVLRGLEQDLPLSLRLSQAAQPPLATVLVERGLIRCVREAGKGQTYRARFLVRQWNSRSLEVELGGAGTRLARVAVGRHELTPRQSPTPRSPGTVFQFDVPATAFSRPVVLEIIYHIPESAPSEGHGNLLGGVQSLFYPPVLRGALFVGRVRWFVQFPSGDIALNPGGAATTEQHWGLRGWLVGPRPALSGTELEQWLTGARGGAGSGNLHGPPGEPSLVCWQSTPQPLTVVHVSEKNWLLACSLVFLVLGLGLSFVAWSRGPLRLVCWVLVVLVGLAAATTFFLWPGVLPAVAYGCEPGAAVLVPVLALQWVIHRRYRRRLVFLPGFTRLKPGSSLIRGGSGSRPREPSTVDAPAAPEGPKP
jgi:hypothetical protein